MILRSLRRRLAETLENGQLGGRLPSAGAWAWQRLASPSRPVILPPGIKVIGVGGAVLGGSGKTPLTQALASGLRRRGLRVGVVASTYPQRVKAAQLVGVNALASRVGDEALMLSRVLSAQEVPVFVGPNRSTALAYAASFADVVVVDGLLQTKSKRLELSLLALDGAEPWGAGRCPPAGDLRAAPAQLLQACDATVCVTHSEAAPLQVSGRPRFRLRCRLFGARTPDGQLIGADALARMKLGACFGVARPSRILQMLREHNIDVDPIWLAADHVAPVPRRPSPRVELWLVTAKCAVKLPTTLAGRPMAVLELEWQLDDSLISLAFSRCSPTPGRAFSPVSEARTPC